MKTLGSAAQPAGCDLKTVARSLNIRDARADPCVHPRRPRLIDPFVPFLVIIPT